MQQLPLPVPEVVDLEQLLAPTPLIWTSKGNLPIAQLKQIPQWNIAEAGVYFALEWYLGDELVRRDVHIYSKEMANG